MKCLALLSVLTLAIGFTAASTPIPLSTQTQTLITNYLNNYRLQHGSPNVTYDLALQTGAQAFATTLAAEQRLYHSDQPYGENLFETSRTSSKYAAWWTQAIDAWYAEGVNYNYTYFMFNASTAHYTQLVWAFTNKIGFGLGTDIHGYNYVVAWFSPPGNVQGNYKQNVKALGSLLPSLHLPPRPPVHSPSPCTCICH